MKDLGSLWRYVRNATSASNKIIQNMWTTLNSRVLGIDYTTSQPTIPKIKKLPCIKVEGLKIEDFIKEHG